MKKVLAKILFWIGDKTSHFDSSFAAWLYVNCMRWSDKLAPWPEIKEQPKKPELGQIRMYRGLTYKIVVFEDNHEYTRFKGYRHDGYINLEIHLRYPDGEEIYTVTNHKAIESEIKSFINKAEAYIDRMLEEKVVKMDMENRILQSLSKE